MNTEYKILIATFILFVFLIIRDRIKYKKLLKKQQEKQKHK